MDESKRKTKLEMFTYLLIMPSLLASKQSLFVFFKSPYVVPNPKEDFIV